METITDLVIEAKNMENRIRELREARGLSLHKLAACLQTSAWQIRRLETGERRLTDAWMMRLAEALEVPPADLFARPGSLPNLDDLPKTPSEILLLRAWRLLTKKDRRALLDWLEEHGVKALKDGVNGR